MKKACSLLLVVMFATGCAKMAQLMQPAGARMVGTNAQYLVNTWGVPNRVFKVGDVVYAEYVQSYYESGWHNHCTTTFTLRNGIVADYKANGNNCKNAGNFVQAAPVYTNGQQPYADPLMNPNSLLNMF